MNTEMTKLENVRKSCKTASMVVKVINIILIIFLIVSIAGAVICFGMSDTINTEMANNPEATENIKMSVNVGVFEATDVLDDLTEIGNYGEAFGLCCVVGIIALGVSIIIVSQVGKILSAILKNDSPFNEVVVKAMRRAFITVVIVTLLMSGLGGALIIAMLFWCLYTVFQYGAELQKQSDETL